jgi:hypothetical protein
MPEFEKITSDQVPAKVRELRERLDDEQWAKFRKACADAHMIWSGACNPSGIARSIVEITDACRPVREVNWACIGAAPVRMAMAQLAFLVGSGIGGYEMESMFDTHVDARFIEAVRDYAEAPQKEEQEEAQVAA